MYQSHDGLAGPRIVCVADDFASCPRFGVVGRQPEAFKLLLRC